jgi:hypothetical protein
MSWKSLELQEDHAIKIIQDSWKKVIFLPKPPTDLGEVLPELISKLKQITLRRAMWRNLKKFNLF